MNSKKFNWRNWLKNENGLNNSFLFFLKKSIIKREPDSFFLSKSHLLKAEENLDFVLFLKNNDKFHNWMIVGCYYVIYHASLALITSKGYSSKNHLATLCTLIKCYFYANDLLSDKDVEIVAVSALKREEFECFFNAKEKREIASYSINDTVNKQQAKELFDEMIHFLNKTREILL